MPPKSLTNSVEIFLKMAQAAREGRRMVPRSANDKEYFAQDWFKDRLDEAGLNYRQQGRNSYPDFLVEAPEPREGYEIKSLSCKKNRPARKDIDFNSTIPSGKKGDQDVFLVFFLYTGSGRDPRQVHSISLANTDLINFDHAVADEHINVAIHKFGSYGDGFIRNRKMYVFPHPLAIDPDGLGRRRLIVPANWKVVDARLKRVATIKRKIAPLAIEDYTIKLHGRGQAEVGTKPYPNAGDSLIFDVFEPAKDD